MEIWIYVREKSGECQGISANSECMNPEGGVFDNKSGMISLLYDWY